MTDAAVDTRAALRLRWSQRFIMLPQEVGATLVDRYAAPARVYHDLHHLSDVLGHVDALADSARDPVLVELAAWFHDAVYEVGRDDNEEASAGLAEALLAPHLTPGQVDEVARLVLLTRDHAVPEGDQNGAVLCDADLAVLGSSSDNYSGYVARVREEYAQVPDATFRAGRAAVLRRLLALPRLFHTTWGATHWERPARANLEAELARLLP